MAKPTRGPPSRRSGSGSDSSRSPSPSRSRSNSGLDSGSKSCSSSSSPSRSVSSGSKSPPASRKSPEAGRRGRSPSPHSKRTSPPPRKASPVSESLVLHIDSLSRNVHEGHLKEIFGTYGEVVYVELGMDRAVNIPRGYGYVEFKNRAAAEKALVYMDGSQIDGNIVRVKFTLPPRQKITSPTKPVASAPKRDVPKTSSTDIEMDGPKQQRERALHAGPVIVHQFGDVLLQDAAHLLDEPVALLEGLHRPAHSRSRSISPRRGWGPAPRRGRSPSVSGSHSPHRAPRRVSRSRSPRRPLRGRSTSNSSSSSSPPRKP